MTTPASSKNQTGRFDMILGCTAIIVLTIAAYLPAIRNGFIWDDDAYVSANATLIAEDGLNQIWTDPTATPQYYPLVHTMYWLEYRLWGMDPKGYHAINIALHAAAAALLWLALRRLSLSGAWLAAAIFALHPVQVESVAWIAERKNVLSGALAMASLLLYLHFALAPDETTSAKRWRYYAFSLLLFVLALLSKTVVAMLAPVILIVLWWKKKGLKRSDVIPLAPMFLLGAAFAGLTVYLEVEHVGASGNEWELSLVERILAAGRALWFYPAKLLAPIHLTFMYPRWDIDASAVWQYLFPAAWISLLIGLAAMRKRIGPGPMVAAAAYSVLIFPALGFFNVYPHRFSFVADHFQYLACVPLIAIFAAGASALCAALGPQRMYALGSFSAALLAILTVASWRQTQIYENEETLYRATITRNPDAWMAYNNLGDILRARGETLKARRMFEQCLKIETAAIDRHTHYSNIGLCHATDGNWPMAVENYKQAVKLRDDFSEGHANLGMALLRMNQGADAIVALRRAVELEPEHVGFRIALANGLSTQNEHAEALGHMREAVRLAPNNADARYWLSRILHFNGETGEALAECQKAILLQPEAASWYDHLAVVLAEVGRYGDAVQAANQGFLLAEGQGLMALTERFEQRMRAIQRTAMESEK